MLSLELHKPTNHNVTDEVGRCCGIHGGIPHDIACPLGGTPHGIDDGQCPETD
jgi:hypothetical protein